jgi:hypothetical protein
MSDWKIGLTPATAELTPSILGPLTAQLAWRRLTKPARAAVEEMTRSGGYAAHPNTMHALRRHGFVEWDSDFEVWHLTEAGAAVAKWMVRDG